MFAALPFDMESRLFGIFLGLTVGSIVTWILTRWRLSKAKRSVLEGDAADTVVIEFHILESAMDADGRPIPVRLRRRYLGQRALNEVIPNIHLSRELRKRAAKVTATDTLISMEGATGTYLLETLCGFVCDRVSNFPFDHDVYIMAPCREPATLAYHKPICVILIARNDLELLLNWEAVSRIEVEHATDGVRILTLMDLAHRFQREQASIQEAKNAGRSVRHMETMFVLDLALDKRAVPLPTRTVPWLRFSKALKQRGIDA